jgi:hypothetical protein
MGCAALFVAATGLCGWLLAMAPDAILAVLGSATLIGAAGSGFAVRAARIGIGGLSEGAAGAPRVAQALRLARAATAGTLVGTLLPILVALVSVLTKHAAAVLLLLAVMAAVVLGMWGMVVDTCRDLLNRASSTG